MSLVTVETTSTLATVFTLVGPLIGVGIGAWGSTRIANGADRRAQRLELIRALASYLSAAELVAVELAAFPETSWFERQVDRLPTQRRVGFFVQTFDDAARVRQTPRRPAKAVTRMPRRPSCSSRHSR